MSSEETIYSPGVMVVFFRDGTHRKVSLLEAERVRHPHFSEEENIRRAEVQLALRQETARRSHRPTTSNSNEGASK